MPDATSLNLANYQALAEFRYQLRRFLRFSEEAAHVAGLEPQHHQLMLAVKGMPDGRVARIADLAERLQLQHHSVVELVGRLVARGLVRRRRDGADRREVHVTLTTHGERLLSELTISMRAELRSAAPALVSALGKIAAPGAFRKPPRQSAGGQSKPSTLKMRRPVAPKPTNGRK